MMMVQCRFIVGQASHADGVNVLQKFEEPFGTNAPPGECLTFIMFVDAAGE